MSQSTPPPTGGEQFTCDLCGETFDKEWTDEEAAAEYAEKFPHEAALGAATAKTAGKRAGWAMADRNAEEAEINPQAGAFERAKLAMLEEERAFEDWWTAQPGGSGVGAYSDLAKAAQATHRSFARLGWMARVREVDGLREALAEIASHGDPANWTWRNNHNNPVPPPSRTLVVIAKKALGD